MLFKLFRYTFLSFREKKQFAFILFSIIGLLFVLFEYFFFRRLFWILFVRFGGLPEQVALIVSSKLLALIFLTTFIMLIFSSSVSALSYLYLEDDLDFLYHLPIRRSTIKLKGVIETFFTASILIFIILIPINLSYFSIKFESVSLFFLSFISLLLFVLSPLSIGTALTVILARYFPAKRLYQFFTVLGVSLLCFLIILIRVSKPENLLNPRKMADVQVIISSIELPMENKLPSTWISRNIIVAGIGDDSRFFDYFSKLSILTLSTLLILFVSVLIFHSKGFLISKERGSLITFKKRSLFERFLLWSLKRFPFLGNIYHILYKDVIVFLRSPAEWGQVFILSALVLIYIFNMKYLPKNIVPFKFAISLLNYATLGFVVSAVSARFSFTSIAMEGKPFFTIKTLPLKMTNLFFEKFLFTFSPLVILSSVIYYFSAKLIELSGPAFYYFFAATILTTFFMTSFAIFYGTISPKFEEKNPTKMLVTVEGFQYMIFSLFYVAFVIILSAKPIYLYYQFLISKSSKTPDWLLPFCIILAVTSICSFIFFKAGIKNLINIQSK